MRLRATITLVLTLLLAGATFPASTESPVTLRLRGANGFAPATVIVSARIEPHRGNREVCAVINNGAFETSSCRPHVGHWEQDKHDPKKLVWIHAPLQVVFEPFRALPDGEYVAVVYVIRINETEGKIEQPFDKLPFRILPPFGGEL